jgi:hypothetical protein
LGPILKVKNETDMLPTETGTWNSPGVITWKKLKNDMHDVYNGTCFRKRSKKTTIEKKDFNPGLFGLDLTEVLYKQNKLRMKSKTLPLLVIECIKWLKDHNGTFLRFSSNFQSIRRRRSFSS